jgi:hypothetical protein
VAVVVVATPANIQPHETCLIEILDDVNTEKIREEVSIPIADRARDAKAVAIPQVYHLEIHEVIRRGKNF